MTGSSYLCSRSQSLRLKLSICSLYSADLSIIFVYILYRCVSSLCDDIDDHDVVDM